MTILTIQLALCVLPILPMSVRLNDLAWFAWQVEQTCAPTYVAATGVLGVVPPATGPPRVAGPFGAAEGCAGEFSPRRSRADCQPRRVSAGPWPTLADRRQSLPQMRAAPHTRHPLFGFGQRFLNSGPVCGPVWRHCRSIEHSHVVPKDCHPDRPLRQPLPSQRRISSQAKGRKWLRPAQSVDDGTQSESGHLRIDVDIVQESARPFVTVRNI